MSDLPSQQQQHDIELADAEAQLDLTSRKKGPDGLTNRQRLLVRAFVENGGIIKDAAVTARFAKGPSGAVHASMTLKLPHVQRAVMTALAERLGAGAVSALAKMIKLSNGARSEYVQLEASKDLLDRAGIRVKDQQLGSGKAALSIDLD